MSIIPTDKETSKIRCRSDILLKNLFPQVKAALFDMDKKYVKPGNTPFHCHFCNINSDNDGKFKVHLQTEEHEENVSKRRKYLSELIESFYTAAQTTSVHLQKTKAGFNLCAKCLMPYYEGAKKHRLTEEHNYSIGMIRPACMKCDKLFTSRIEQEIHQVSLDHIYSEVAYKRRKALHGSKTVEIPEEFDPDVPVGMEYVRHTVAFYCTPCGINFKRDVDKMKEHCQEESHIEKTKEFVEKLKPVRMARLAEIEKEKTEKTSFASEKKEKAKEKEDEDQESDENKETEEMMIDE